MSNKAPSESRQSIIVELIKTIFPSLVNIMVAIIGCMAVIIAALISISVNKSNTDQQLTQVTITSTPNTPTNFRSATSTSVPTSISGSVCQDVKIYFEFLDSEGRTLIKCPDANNIVTFSYNETNGLTNLFGQAIGPAITHSETCEWQWYTNENLSEQTIRSPKENCSFSVKLTGNVTSIYLKLISDVNQPFFTIKIQK